MDRIDAALVIVAAIIRRGDEVLLVEQQGANDPAPSWALPGGRVEPGELLIDALVREVREETGIIAHAPSRLAYLAQHVRLDSSGIVTVFAFEVGVWEGTIHIADPDGLILQARFLPVPDAIQKLEHTLSWRAMREPVVEYLRGNTHPGAMWFYRLSENGEFVLTKKIESSR